MSDETPATPAAALASHQHDLFNDATDRAVVTAARLTSVLRIGKSRPLPGRAFFDCASAGARGMMASP